jgi:hypothetical protein
MTKEYLSKKDYDKSACNINYRLILSATHWLIDTIKKSAWTLSISRSEQVYPKRKQFESGVLLGFTLLKTGTSQALLKGTSRWLDMQSPINRAGSKGLSHKFSYTRC